MSSRSKVLERLEEKRIDWLLEEAERKKKRKSKNNRIYYNKNREQVLEKNRLWREKHPNYFKQYRQRNKQSD